MSVHKVDVEPREIAQAPNGKYFARLAYYMQELAEQKEWRKVSGIVVGDSEEDAQTKAKAVSDELDGLTVFEMAKKVKGFIAEGRMHAHVRSLK